MGIEPNCHANGAEPDCESRLAGGLVGLAVGVIFLGRT
jgi:Leu/Phe-tRNA-protein transferase